MFRRAVVCWLGLVFVAGLLAAQPKPSSDLLLPWFEVDLEGGEATTVFAVVNALDKPVDVVATVHTNWAIPVLDVPLRLKAREIRTFDLRQWLADGSLPRNRLSERLSEETLAHLQAALSGRRSPKDDLYYSSPIPGVAAGYLTLRTAAGDALRGVSSAVRPGRSAARYEDLIDIGSPAGLCNRYVLRQPPNAGAEAFLWQDAVGQPSPTPVPDEHRLQVATAVVSERGERVEDRPRMVLPLERLSLDELGPAGPDGWIEIAPEGSSFLSLRGADGRPLGLLKAACAEARPKPSKAPKISIVKLTNGRDAGAAPGASIPVGAPVLWQYQVTNSGKVTLKDIEVFDDQGVAVTCPKKTLKAGQAMSCTGKGVAEACQYSNTGLVSGTPDQGAVVTAQDTSFYFGEENAALQFEVTTNGQEADDPRGPTLPVGARVDWVYQVTNSGKARLTDIQVQDDHGAEVLCPTVALAPGQSMDCTASGFASAGQYRNVGTVTARTACGPISAQDASHYFGESNTGILLRTLTNGFDANDPPGPSIGAGAPVTWEYVVTNTGKLFLSQLEVRDDHGVAVSCPKNTLNVAESITCIARGVASACQYSNLGTVTAWTSGGQQVSASDRSHYTGGAEAGIRIESSVNGDDADSPPGPTVTVGLPASWTYMVSNVGKVVLTGVAITNGSLTVTCPKTELRAGESMICTGSGTAEAGQYAGIATAKGQASCGSPVSDDDPGHYFGRPGGADDSAILQEDAPATTIDVLRNDGGVGPGTFKVVGVSDPANGTVAISQNGGALTYRPDKDYCSSSGPDLFTYTASPGNTTLSVSVTVECVDDLPQAKNDVATLTEGAAATAIGVLDNDLDVDDGPRSIASVSQPLHGTAGVTGGGIGLSYMPHADYCNNPPGLESDTFTYTLEPGGATATVSVLVECENDPPAAVDDQFTRQEDSGPTQLDVLANDKDVDEGTLAIADVSTPDNGTVTIDQDDQILTYTPRADYCNDSQPGQAQEIFTYTLADGGGTATVSVKVTCVDDPPVAVDDVPAVNEDAGGMISVAANDSNEDGGPITVDSITQPAHGTAAIVGGGLVVSYTPNAGYCNSLPIGTPRDVFSYTLTPGGSTATVSVKVNCENDEPVLTQDAATVAEDSGASPIDVLANDFFPDGAEKKITFVTRPAHGTAAISADGLSLSYTPDADYCNDDPPGTSPDTFTYSVPAGSAATVEITVACGDDSPVAVDDELVVAEDSPDTTLNVLANDTNPDGGAMTIASNTPPGNGTAAVAPGGLTLTYRPDPDYCNKPPGTAPDTFTYTLMPGNKTAQVKILVTCVDDSPTAVNDVFTFAEDSGIHTLTVLANDADPDGGAKTISSKTDPVNGTLTLSGGTSLTYKPNLNYCNLPTTPDTFTYTLSPGGSEATVSVQVTCVNDPPVATNDAFDTIGNTELRADLTAADTPFVGTANGALDNDVDVDGDPISVAGVQNCSDRRAPFDCPTKNGGRIALDADGAFSFVPKAGDTKASDSFVYRLTGGTGTGTVTLSLKARVWYVKSGAPAGGTGGSTSPFNSLAPLSAAKANDYIFVYLGNGSALSGLALKTGQRLIGEHAGLSIPEALNGQPAPAVLADAVPGNRPLINNVSGTNVLPAEIAGISLGGTANAVSLQTSGTGTLAIRDNLVRTSGILIRSSSGTLTLNVEDNTWTTTAASHASNGFDAATAGGSIVLGFKDNKDVTSSATAVLIQDANTADTATLTVTDFENNTVHPATLGTGMDLRNVIFDAVSGGDTVIGVPGGVDGKGLVLTTVSGSLEFTSLTIEAAGTGLEVIGTGPTVMTLTANDSRIKATGGPAVSAENLTLDLHFTQIESANSSSNGVYLSGVTGTFSAGPDSHIDLPASATGSAFRIFNSNVAVDYEGRIRGQRGILLQNNDPATTIRFSGDLDLKTGSGDAFVATNAGTVIASHTANRLETTTGVSLKLTGTDIGLEGLSFQEIRSDGAPTGIEIAGTAGSTGGLTVLSGSIRNCSGDAVKITGLRDLTLNDMDIQDIAGYGIELDNVSGTVAITDNNFKEIGKAGIHLSNSTDGSVQIEGNRLDEIQQSGIQFDATGLAAGRVSLVVKDNLVDTPQQIDHNGILIESTISNASGNRFCVDLVNNGSAGSGVRKGIGLAKAPTALFDIVGLTGGVVAWVDSQNAADAELLDQTTGFNSCTP
jgi:hypothetical protein